MIRLVKAEIYKLYKTRAFKILCIIALLLAFLVIGLSKLASSEDFIKSSLKNMTPEQQDQFIDQLQNTNSDSDSVVQSGSNMGFRISSKDIFHPKAVEIFHGAFGAGTMEILISVLIGALVAGEYSSGTIKNILAYGKKREHYYIAKLFSITIGFSILLGIIVAVASIGSTIIFGWGTSFNILQVLEVFIASIVVGMSVISLLMLIATLVKSNGATIGIGIVVFSVLPTIISYFYGKYNWFDRVYEVTPAYNWALVTSINATDGDILKAVAISLISVLIVTIAGIMIFKRQDIR